MSAVDHIRGRTVHIREGRVTNKFAYGVDYILCDPEAAVGPALFSRNQRNLTALWDRDHGGAPGRGTAVSWVRDVLAAHGLTSCDGRILLLAQPRVFGHVFNPVSFWLCYDQEEQLRAAIAEVSNTFGDRHSYLIHHPDQRPILARDRLSAVKAFHVSPFLPIEGGYRFRFDIRSDRVGVWIDYRSERGRLYATLTGKRQPLSNAGILAACARRPFGSLRVLALIYWQAMKLRLRGAPWHVRPEPPTVEISQ